MKKLLFEENLALARANEADLELYQFKYLKFHKNVLESKSGVAHDRITLIGPRVEDNGMWKGDYDVQKNKKNQNKTPDDIKYSKNAGKMEIEKGYVAIQINRMENAKQLDDLLSKPGIVDMTDATNPIFAKIRNLDKNPTDISDAFQKLIDGKTRELNTTKNLEIARGGTPALKVEKTAKDLQEAQAAQKSAQDAQKSAKAAQTSAEKSFKDALEDALEAARARARARTQSEPEFGGDFEILTGQSNLSKQLDPFMTSVTMNTKAQGNKDIPGRLLPDNNFGQLDTRVPTSTQIQKRFANPRFVGETTSVTEKIDIKLAGSDTVIGTHTKTTYKQLGKEDFVDTRIQFNQNSTLPEASVNSVNLKGRLAIDMGVGGKPRKFDNERPIEYHLMDLDGNFRADEGKPHGDNEIRSGNYFSIGAFNKPKDGAMDVIIKKLLDDNVFVSAMTANANTTIPDILNDIVDGFKQLDPSDKLKYGITDTEFEELVANKFSVLMPNKQQGFDNYYKTGVGKIPYEIL